MSLPSFRLDSGFIDPNFETFKAFTVDPGLDGIVGVLLALDEVGAVALLVGLLAAEVVVIGLGRSLIEALGGLRPDVNGLLGGIVPLTGGFWKLFGRDFSGDMGPFSEEGFEDGVDDRMVADMLNNRSPHGTISKSSAS